MPQDGHRFNPAKLLLDPYAKARSPAGREATRPSLAIRSAPAPTRTCAVTGATARRSSPSVVIDPAFPWEQDRPPRTPWHHTLIYEVHVKGLTARHPEVPPGGAAPTPGSPIPPCWTISSGWG